LSISTSSTAPVPPGLVIAPQLPDLLLPVAIRRGVLGFLRNHPTVAIGGALLLCLVLVGIFAPWLGTVDPTALAPAKRTRLPSADYWFGTDVLGRDIYSRVLYGTRVSLSVGLSVAVLASLVGLAIGLVSGFVRWADGILMRFMDGLMSIPPILLAIALMALTRASVGNVILAITVAEIPRVSRLVRSVVLSLREHAGADAGPGNLYLRQCHDRGVDPLFHRCWHTAHHSVLGQHHGRRQGAVAGKALHRVLSRRVSVRHRARRQSAWRRPARCARSANGQEPLEHDPEKCVPVFR
jgi:hypothetical protein